MGEGAADLENVVALETASHVPHYQHAAGVPDSQRGPEVSAMPARASGAVRQERRSHGGQLRGLDLPHWHPMPVDDYGPVACVGYQGVEACPDSDQCLNTLGAILYRAGRHEEGHPVACGTRPARRGPDAADSIARVHLVLPGNGAQESRHRRESPRIPGEGKPGDP